MLWGYIEIKEIRMKVLDKVWITYPTAPRRGARVVEVHDDGTVTVAWRTWKQDPGRPHRRRAGYWGPEHRQRLSAGRLLPRSS